MSSDHLSSNLANQLKHGVGPPIFLEPNFAAESTINEKHKALGGMYYFIVLKFCPPIWICKLVFNIHHCSIVSLCSSFILKSRFQDDI